MNASFSRRGFLATSAALAASPFLPRPARAETPALALRATTRTLDIGGRAATVYGLVNAAGGPGLTLDPGARFRVDLRNDLPVETLIHWHGQIPPNLQDGVPDMPMPKLRPGESRAYDFAALPGTYWMHSHIPAQEMQLLAAPLIVRSAEDAAADRQEVVMFLHDFSFRSPEEILAEVTGTADTGMAGMDHSAHGAMAMTPPAASAPMAGMDMSGHDMSGTGMTGMTGMATGGMSMGGMNMEGMGDMAMDLNDVNFDAYLANDRTLDDPEVVAVERGGRVKLRVINAAAATIFWIDTGALSARLVAVDGEPVVPLSGTRFGLAMAQRLDLEIDLPAGEGAYPLLALREGARERTGLILATPGGRVGKIAALGETETPAFDTDMAQERQLSAANPLAARPVENAQMLMLAGGMQPYVWTINGQVWGNHTPIAAVSGTRVELSFHNMSMMSHPMHLHGHKFQVVAINGRRFAGALRDTVLVPPMTMVTVAFDAGEAARWMLHCHHMLHLSTGMMTELAISA
jgi:FtsP/CotA-like multicopper oxidase with cupredoxin domain